MREIEFRGKRIDNSEWAYGSLMQFEDSATFIFVDAQKGASTLTYAHFIINNMHAIDEKTVEQYTGLKDKNGNKIFEGDIVRNINGEYSYIGIVNKDRYTFYIKGVAPKDNYDFADVSDTVTGKSSLIVIGNIHENPELLEGTE
ncbi:YopX family protein [Listeria monocytogenes]